MTNRFEPIAAEHMRQVAGGNNLNGTPLGSLSLFIAGSSDPSRSVAKSFDVLTLSSPVVGVERVAHGNGHALPKIAGTPVPRRRGRWTSGQPDQSRTVTVGDLVLVAAAARKRRRP